MTYKQYKYTWEKIEHFRNFTFLKKMQMFNTTKICQKEIFFYFIRDVARCRQINCDFDHYMFVVTDKRQDLGNTKLYYVKFLIT